MQEKSDYYWQDYVVEPLDYLVELFLILFQTMVADGEISTERCCSWFIPHDSKAIEIHSQHQQTRWISFLFPTSFGRKTQFRGIASFEATPFWDKAWFGPFREWPGRRPWRSLWPWGNHGFRVIIFFNIAWVIVEDQTHNVLTAGPSNARSSTGRYPVEPYCSLPSSC